MHVDEIAWLDAQIQKLEDKRRALSLSDFGTEKALRSAKASLSRKVNRLCDQRDRKRRYGVLTA